MAGPKATEIVAELEAESARWLTYIRNVAAMVTAKINPARTHADATLIEGTYFVVAVVGPYTYRFGVPPDERMWVCEYRNDVCDPPGQWDHYGDGPLTSRDQTDVADWIVEVLDKGGDADAYMVTVEENP